MNNTLELAIERIAARIPFSKLEQAAIELSQGYRMQTEGQKAEKPYMLKEEHKIAYLALRLPATFASISAVLKHIPIEINSLLDIGSGPGTAYLAASLLFPKIQETLLIEKDSSLIRLGQELIGNQKTVNFRASDMKSFVPERSYDLITAAYALSELPETQLQTTLSNLWKAADPLICIIEPGTPYGFKTILQARAHLIQQGAHILAPCTHENACPWLNTQEWCHFSVRFDRTRLQKRVKNAFLGYEDEKYSYLIASKVPLVRPASRIVKTPIKRSGFINFTLCDSTGIHSQIFSKKQGEAYQAVKKLEWGDGL